MKMKHKLLLASLLAALSTSLHADLVLANFDQPEAPGFKFTAPVEKSDFDGDGDLEGKITGTGYQTIAKYRITRDAAATLLSETPYLNVAVNSTPRESTGNFLAIMVALQTNATGTDVYEPATNLKFEPWNVDTSGFKLVLGDLKTKSLPSLQEALADFAKGGGDHFYLVLIQQTQKGEKSVAYYDDIYLSAE